MKPGPILLVEDNDDDAFLTERALVTAGITHPIHRCSGGQAVIDFLQKLIDAAPGGGEVAAPVLVLLDLKLPAPTGLDVLDWIRRQPLFDALLILILTSSREDRDVAEAYRRRVNAYLVKPASLAEMVELARALRGFWLEQPHLVRPHLNFSAKVGTLKPDHA